MILADWQIREQIKIEPFAEGEPRPGVISYGLSSFGYDMRVGNKFRVVADSEYTTYGARLDPKKNCNRFFTEVETDALVLPPNNFALAESVEYFEIPRNIMAVCVGKSTYARVGVVINITPLEPEWRGRVTIEISNTTFIPVVIHANEGIAQVLFFRGEPCQVSYEDKKGVYQNQAGLTHSLVRK